MKGYKAFDKDLKCRDLQYEVGKTTEVNGEIEVCGNGLHFCEKLNAVFNYYPKTTDTRVCEVEATGDIKTKEDKSVTNSLKIIRELSKEEIASLTDNLRFNSGDYNSGDYNSGDYNSGDYNSGHYNSGDYNSGDYNSGNRNSGDLNSGNYNSGNRNSGDYNSGHYNSGHCNSGDYNSGDYNSGDCNSGDYNSGNYNSGHYNSGYRNSGNYNSGNRNSGYRNSGNYNSGNYNSGNRNSGYRNSGNYNSGNYNSGNYNSGNYNSGDYNSGFFNTDEPTVRMFNKDSGFLRKDLPNLSFVSDNWKEHLTYVYSDSMTEQEKLDNPSHATTGGFIRKDTEYSYKKSWERVWSKITEEQRNIIKNLPNFDADIFEEITGIKVEVEMVRVTVNGVEKEISLNDAKRLGLV